MLAPFKQVYIEQMITVQEQYWSYPFLSYVADVGGYVGVFLGVSFFQLSNLILFLTSGLEKACRNLTALGNLGNVFYNRFFFFKPKFTNKKKLLSLKNLPWVA